MSSLFFQQKLSGLIKALRANKRDEKAVIQQALAEIKEEVTSKDWDVKGAAVLKLTYLEMLGHPTLIQHSFHVIECMASPKFHIKQIGYLAASQSFGESTEVILLANNLIKKDLQASSSTSASVVILALTSLPTLLSASPQLADDLLPDLLRMLTHSKAQVRRIATLVIGKVWASQHALALEFAHVEKLRAGLGDPDQSVVSATVNVMLELARDRKDALPSLLSLAPELFDILTTSTNNWMLIKIVKLFALLTPIEPRLVRKLVAPLSTIISTTPAFSLLYESIQTVITGGMLSSPSSEAASLATTCIDKLSSFLSDADQNLRYIALKGLSRLMQTHAYLLTNHYEEVLACIDEEDLTIRLKALEIVERLTDRSNTRDIVTKLLSQISPTHSSATKKGKQTTNRSAAAALRAVASNYDPSSPAGLAEVAPSTAMGNGAYTTYKSKLLSIILRITSRASDDGNQLYVNVSNFQWFIDTLVSVAYLARLLPAAVSINTKVSEILLDVTSRATAVQELAIGRMTRLLADETFVGSGREGVQPVVQAAAFIVSEYCSPNACLATCQTLLACSQKQTGSTLTLNAVKCLAKWLNSFTADSDWRDESLPGITSELLAVARSLDELPYVGLPFSDYVRLVVKNLAGPRLATSKLDTQVVEEDPADDNPESLQHNPFAAGETSASVKLPRNTPEAGTGDPKGAPKVLKLLHSMCFAYELRPLALGAQAAVPVPEGLDLDTWIGQPFDESLSEDASASGTVEVDEYGRPQASSVTSASMRDNGGNDAVTRAKKSKRKSEKSSRKAVPDVDSIPIVKLDLGDAEATNSPPSSSSKRTRSIKPSRPRIPSPPPLILSAGGDMPSGPRKLVTSTRTDSTSVSTAQEPQIESSILEPPLKVVKVKRKKKSRSNADSVP